MRGELVIVGDEVLDGRVLNVNAHHLAARLAALGLGVARITTVGDEPEVMRRVLAHAVEKSDYVIVTGGLGPTDDDLTAAAAAEAFGRPLTLHRDILDRITETCRRRGREVGLLERLAWLPEGSEPLCPDRHFCGFSLTQEEAYVFFLPGVPEEVRELMDTRVLPRLLDRFTQRPHFEQRIIKLFGLFESQIAARLGSLGEEYPQISLGSYPYFPEVHLSLTAKGESEADVRERLDGFDQALTERLGAHIFGRDEETLPGVLGRMLTEKGLTLATAESCTGGRAGQLITSAPGSSAYFIQGVITYANRAKVGLLGVSEDDLEAHGAVSPQVAGAMAEGLRERAGVDLAISITGVAGPDGGTPEKPVGTVYFGLAGKDRTVVEKRLFPGDRKRVQALSAHTALDLIRRNLAEYF